MLATYQTNNYSYVAPNYSNGLSESEKIELELIEIEEEERRRRREKDAELEAKREVWREFPAVYAEERLGIILTNEQLQVFISVKNNRRTAVKSHHSFGKTFVCAIILLWWIDCWPRNIGYITAPTWGQALRLTFKQAKRLAMKNKLDFDILDTGIIRDKDKFTATERFIQALNADSGEGFQGEHTAPILIVKDESVGIKQYIHDAAEGLMTDADCRLIEISNATDEATEFGNNCESPNYEVFTFSALDHANIEAELKCEEVPFKGAIRLLWLFEQLRDECEVTDSLTESCFEFYSLEVVESALNGIPAPPIIRDEEGNIDHEKSGYSFYKPTAFFEGRVLGEFPTQASNKVIPKAWLKLLGIKPLNPQGKIQIGCDPARFGDDRSTMFARIGQVVIKAKVVRKFDNVAVTAAIKEMVEDVIKFVKDSFGITITKKDIVIAIDVTGGLGTGPHDTLKDEGYQVTGVNSSSSPKNDEKYVNIRSELWFDVRDRAKSKELDYSRLDPDIKRTLEKELGTPEYKLNSKGKKVVEEKSEIKKRLGASPDLADGFNLAFYEAEIKTSGSMEFEDY